MASLLRVVHLSNGGIGASLSGGTLILGLLELDESVSTAAAGLTVLDNELRFHQRYNSINQQPAAAAREGVLTAVSILPYFSKCSVRDCSSVDHERPLEGTLAQYKEIGNRQRNLPDEKLRHSDRCC